MESAVTSPEEIKHGTHSSMFMTKDTEFQNRELDSEIIF